MSEFVELPPSAKLVRSTGWNLAESFGFPVAGYAIGIRLGGRDAGLWAMLGAIWVKAVLRRLMTGSIPSLVVISMAMLTVQPVTAVITGN